MTDEKTIRLHLLTCDAVSTYNGRTYPRFEVEKAVAEFNMNVVNLGSLGPHDAMLHVDLDKVSHRVVNTVMEGDDVFCDIVMLDTQRGKQAADLMSAGVDLRLSPVMVGIVAEGLTVSELEFKYTSLLLPGE